jgi:hypothetical protein
MDSKQPARTGYPWPEFKAGNELATQHGAYSPRKVDPLARELVDGLVAVAGQAERFAYLTEPQYGPALWAWGRTEARVQLVSEWLLKRGDLDGDGEVRPAADLLSRVESRVQ